MDRRNPTHEEIEEVKEYGRKLFFVHKINVFKAVGDWFCGMGIGCPNTKGCESLECPTCRRVILEPLAREWLTQNVLFGDVLKLNEETEQLEAPLIPIAPPVRLTPRMPQVQRIPPEVITGESQSVPLIIDDPLFDEEEDEEDADEESEEMPF